MLVAKKVNGQAGQLVIYDELCDPRLCSPEYRQYIIKLFNEVWVD